MQEAVEPNIKNVYLLGGVFVLIAPPIYATMNSPSRCDWGFSPKDSAFPSSSGRDSEEHMIYGQYYPGFATPRDISQLPISHTTAIVPDFFRFPRGILALDPLIQHPPRPLEPPFTGSFSPPGTTIVGPPFPSHQAVVRATSPTLAIGFCAPSGASIPPGSACAPPPHLQWSPKSLYPYPYGPRPGMSTVTVPSGQFVTQPQLLSVSRFGPAGHVQPPGTALVSRYSTAATPENVHTSSLKPSVLCPICGNESRRSQERDRHMLSHLPCWIACSLDGCRWRGDRRDNFKKHLWDEHQTIMLDEHGYQLYDPKPLVKGIVKGSISIEDAERCAIPEVEGMALVLSKPEMLEDPSGRKGKKYSRR